ncbi:MAG: FHA domain-containing protein [Deltaproteobacteria bacterium]|nr:FHA domain-containing protein [Deltaproteobacteria bacterium]
MFFLRLDLRGGRGRVPIDRLLVIGRSNTADLILDAPVVSRVHCRICLRDDDLVLEDLGSATGTQRNGVPIKAPEPLDVGDIIDIGTFSFVIEDAQHRSVPQRRPALSPKQTSDDAIVPSDLINPSDLATEHHTALPSPVAPAAPRGPPGGGLAALRTADEILPPNLDAIAPHEAPHPHALGLSPSTTTIDARPPTWPAADREAPSLGEDDFDEETTPRVRSGKSPNKSR